MAANPERSWIRDLRPGAEVAELYVVRSREVRQRRGGGPYLAVTLGDRTGEVDALVWENVEALGEVLEPGRVVRIRGQVQRYNRRLQVIVRRAEEVDGDGWDQADFVRASAVEPEELRRQIEQIIAGIDDPHLKQLLFRVFADAEVASLFVVVPAARGMHHAYRAGLAEHTVSMAVAAKALAAHYGLDPDLVVAGALLHDLGKVWELEIGSSIEYTDDGRLLGHLALEVLFVDRKIAELPAFPEELRRHLLHILLAHHGEYEYGAPRRPKTPEALLVHLIDTLDSKMAGMFEAIGAEGDGSEAWTGYSKILDRYVYRRPPPTVNGRGRDD